MMMITGYFGFASRIPWQRKIFTHSKRSPD